MTFAAPAVNDEQLARQLQRLETERGPPCRHFARGFCRDGNLCVYRHDDGRAAASTVPFDGVSTACRAGPHRNDRPALPAATGAQGTKRQRPPTSSPSLYHTLLSERRAVIATTMPTPPSSAVAASALAAHHSFTQSLRSQSPSQSRRGAVAGGRSGGVVTSRSNGAAAADERRAMAMDLDGASYEALLELQERIGHVRVGLTPEQLQQLPATVIRTRRAAAAMPTCTVCYDDYSVGDTTRILPCRHTFHAACIDRWLEAHKRCPVCQGDVSDGLGRSVKEEVAALLSAHFGRAP